MSVEQVYEESVKGLPRKEQLKLASLILQQLTKGTDTAEYDDEWSEEDLRQLTGHSLRYAAQQYPEEEELV